MIRSDWVRVGACAGFLAVMLGAFGAHGLKDVLDRTGRAANYQTAFEYHMAHSLAITVVGLLSLIVGGNRRLEVAGWLFLLGIILFSGSLYILALTGLTWLGAITPFGGLAFLAGWVVLAFCFGKGDILERQPLKP